MMKRLAVEVLCDDPEIAARLPKEITVSPVPGLAVNLVFTPGLADDLHVIGSLAVTRDGVTVRP